VRHQAIRAFAVASAIALPGCGDQAASIAGVVVTEADSSGVRTVTIRGPVDALPEWRLSEAPLTEINGNSPPFISDVGAAAFLADGGLLVYDRQSAELRLFGPDGGQLRLLAAAGDGPGELRALEQLTVTPSDTIYAFDRRHNRISVFNPDGSFQAAIAVDPQLAGPDTSIRHAWILDHDRLLWHGVVLGESGPASGAPKRELHDRIIQVDSADGTEQGSAVRFAGEFGVRGALGELGSPFSNRPFVVVGPSRVLHGSGSTYELVLRDFDLRPLAVISWLGWERRLSPSLVETLRDPMAASLSELRAVNPEAADQLMEDVLRADALPEFLPALGSALLDEDGRIWVSRFRPTEDLRVATTGGYEQWHQEDAWHVLESDGTPLARVRLPSETRLLAVRNDRVAVVSRDAVGVEYVRVLQINAAGG